MPLSSSSNLKANLRRFTSRLLHFFSPGHQELIHQLELMLGFRPIHLPYYQLALMHRSRIEELAHNNERLEFLGDAVLGAIVAEYLFKKYPNQPEGYLTEFRSRIVRRESLNSIALQMGLNKLVQYNKADRGLGRSHIFGNALEALIGAVYLDVGFVRTRKFIVQVILKGYVDLHLLETTDTNYKNQLLNWAQRGGHDLHFESMGETIAGARKIFTVGIKLNGNIIAEGTGYTKKEAGQAAAQKALKEVGE
jgi:ribonuclease-3